MFNIFLSDTKDTMNSKTLEPWDMQELLLNLYKMRIALRYHGLKVRHHHGKGSNSMIRVYQK